MRRIPSSVRPRELRHFQRGHSFSLTINDSNKPGNLLSLNKQVPTDRIDGVRTQFWHSKKAGGRSPSLVVFYHARSQKRTSVYLGNENLIGRDGLDRVDGYFGGSGRLS
jgi:hypothetical protein